MNHLFILVFFFFSCLGLGFSTEKDLNPYDDDVQALMSIKANSEFVTVSGLSAGAFMAHQLHVAYSKRIKGVGIIAGGPYFCAENSTRRAIDHCMKGTDEVDFNNALREIKSEFKKGNIDDPKNLKDSKAFLFLGMNDQLVAKRTMSELEKFYKKFLAPGSLQVVFDHKASHGIPTLDYGINCQAGGYYNSPWLLNCNYDAAGKILKKIHGPLKGQRGEMDEESLLAFDQNEFAGQSASFGPHGFVYIPKKCRQGGCSIHIALHGCDQDPFSVGDLFIVNAGYNEWAESSSIIILYPSIHKSYIYPYNPLGCFDWWGYSGYDYHVKKGTQMRAIMRMVDRLSG